MEPKKLTRTVADRNLWAYVADWQNILVSTQ